MALNDDIHLLSQLPLFKDMSEDQLRLVAFGADRRAVGAGQMLFREGSPADSAYLVVDGSFDLQLDKPKGPAPSRDIVGPGVLLSELALVTMVERKFSAIAREDSTVIRITRTLFHRLIEEYPDVAQIIEKRIHDNIALLARQATAQLPRFS